MIAGTLVVLNPDAVCSIANMQIEIIRRHWGVLKKQALKNKLMIKFLV
jgi:hypothetical protein